MFFEKICPLLNSVQEIFEIKAWILLTFFICLHNQLSSINSSHIKKYMFYKVDSSNTRKMNGSSYQQVLRQIFELVFVLTQKNSEV